MRKCTVKYYNDDKRIVTESGLFHQWGTEGFEDRDGNFMQQTVAIVELSNGKIVTTEPQSVQFVIGE